MFNIYQKLHSSHHGKSLNLVGLLLLRQYVLVFLKPPTWGTSGSQDWGSKGCNHAQVGSLRPVRPACQEPGWSTFQFAQGRMGSLHFCGRNGSFATPRPPIWFPHRNRGWYTCCCRHSRHSGHSLQRDGAFSLWLMSVIYGHHAGADRQTGTWAQGRSPLFLFRGFSQKAPNMLLGSVCSIERNEKNLLCGWFNCLLPRSFIPERRLVQVSTWLSWKHSGVSTDMLIIVPCFTLGARRDTVFISLLSAHPFKWISFLLAGIGDH